jgi:hypothetical protein
MGPASETTGYFRACTHKSSMLNAASKIPAPLEDF